MLKLLLKEEKNVIKKEYIFRFLTILFFGLSAVIALFLISLVPTYFLLKIDQKVLTQELDVAQDSELNIERKKLKEKLADLQQTLNIVDTPNTEISFYIQKITERQPRDVSILNLSFEKVGGKEVVTVQGNANGRSSLASFIDVLEEVPEFENVNLPFSSFTRDSDIPFSITINILDKTTDEN